MAFQHERQPRPVPWQQLFRLTDSIDTVRNPYSDFSDQKFP